MHPAGRPELAHARIDNRVPGLPALPALQRENGNPPNRFYLEGGHMLRSFQKLKNRLASKPTSVAADMVMEL